MGNQVKTLTPVLALTLALTISTSAVAMPNMAPAAPAPAAPAAPANQAATISGKVAETFNSGGYSYVAVEKQGQRVWVASRPVKVAVGQEVSFQSGFVMRNFTSNSLGRTFETIVFTQGLATVPPPAAAPTPEK